MQESDDLDTILCDGPQKDIIVQQITKLFSSNFILISWDTS